MGDAVLKESRPAFPGAMSQLESPSVASMDDYCPYPAPTLSLLLSTLFSRHPWLPILLVLWAVLSVYHFPTVFKWWKKQRLSFYIIERTFLTLAPALLDKYSLLTRTPFFGPALVRWKFKDLQDRVPSPPQHLMSSAPSNCPGLLTVTQKCDRNCENGKDCRFHGVLTSDDFPVLPGQPRLYRTVDGFGNCPYSPHIGQAAQPYSYLLSKQATPKTDAGGNLLEKKLPEVEDVFKHLLCRSDFQANEAGLNCLILDFATLLTHDLFNTRNGFNQNSSYADLSPLYGTDAESARRVRTFERGKLDLKKVPYSRSASVEQKIAEKMKKIAAGEEVVGGDPDEDREDVMKLRNWAEKYNWDWGFVGWRALVELFGREHNYVAEKLLEWYPERFSHKFDQKGLHKTDKDGNWIKDEDLYQTARYITTRVYANIVVTDYAANFLGLKEMNDFVLDRPKRLGNCCSYEFGLLYHWHCMLADDNQHFKGMPCLPNDKHLKKRGPLEGDYYDKLEGVEDHKKTFRLLLKQKEKELNDLKEEQEKIKKLKEEQEKLKKQAPAVPGGGPLGSQEAHKNAEDVDHLPDTDIDLEKLLLSRYNTRIGRFGAFHTPEYMKQAEMRTLHTARRLGAGSYNDFREHLGLMRCKTYEEINPDKKVAKALRTLYEGSDTGNEWVDNVELYAGVFAERPGVKGIKFGQVLSMGLLEDALNLIRNDRLLVDFDQNSATPKGYHHAVTSHFADVIERNTKLKLAKQQEGPPTLVDYKSKYDKTDWRHWRLASCALLTMPHEPGTARKEIFEAEGLDTAELRLFETSEEAFEKGRKAGINEGQPRPPVEVIIPEPKGPETVPQTPTRVADSAEALASPDSSPRE